MEVFQVFFYLVYKQVLHLATPLEVFQVLFFVFALLELLPGVDFSLWGIDESCMRVLSMVPFTPHVAVHYYCWLVVAPLL